MKAYTDINQSKKLAEILPIESADMVYYCNKSNNTPISQCPFVRSFKETDVFSYLYCWSLAALLNYIKDKCGYFELVYLSSTSDGNKLENVHRLSTDLYDVYENELIDACYKMIIKLHEQKKLL